jgi:nicotinamide-nucleotide amidase
MHIAIMTTGDELLRGELVDTNTAWLSEQLAAAGLVPRTHLTIGDDLPHLSQSLRRICEEHDIAIITGGLGPTQDDYTVEAVASTLGVDVVIHERSLTRAREYFDSRGLEFPENNRRQAMVPAGCDVFVNPAGLAPAFRFQLSGCVAYCLPGVPRELKALWREAIWPDLQSTLPELPPAAYRVLKLFGVPESYLARDVADLLAGHPEVQFGFRAHYPEVWFKFLVPGASLEQANETADALTAAVRERFGHRLYGEGSQTLASVVSDHLRHAGMTLATAESCTGGLVGATLTSLAGSSDYYLGGAITYSNEMKEQVLGVPGTLLARHGAVSEACARAMATGARARFGSDLAIAVTGIAGPGGGSVEKPVGTVHFALATPTGTYHRLRSFRAARDAVQKGASATALNLVRRYLLGALETTDPA